MTPGGGGDSYGDNPIRCLAVFSLSTDSLTKEKVAATSQEAVQKKAGEARDGARHAGQRAEEKGREAKDRVEETGRGAKERVSRGAEDVAERAKNGVEAAKEKGREVKDRVTEKGREVKEAVAGPSSGARRDAVGTLPCPSASTLLVPFAPLLPGLPTHLVELFPLSAVLGQGFPSATLQWGSSEGGGHKLFWSGIVHEAAPPPPHTHTYPLVYVCMLGLP